MADPTFQILSDTNLYSNDLTPLQLRATITNEYSSSYFSWDLGDGAVGVGETVNHVYKDVGDYDITLTQYLPSGEPVTSLPQTVTVRNLIPNLARWVNDSDKIEFITASIKSDTPFVVNLFNSWQQYSENSVINFYVENSKSIPFDITDKKIHLKPNWRFLNRDGEVINEVLLNQVKIYGTNVGGKIYLTEDSNNTVFVGVSSQAEFFFVDDTPTGVDPAQENPRDSTIIVSQDMSSVYGDKKFTSEDYLHNPSVINSVTVKNIIPEKLSITSNGIFDIDPVKFINSKIPYNIRLVDSNGNFIKTNPVVGSPGYKLDIGFIGDVSTEPNPSFNNNELEQFNPDFSNLGGFFESYFIPTSPTTESVILTASVALDYLINKIPTKYGVFSDTNSNKIYRVKYVKDIEDGYLSKSSEVENINIYDGLYSNKFGAIVDFDYNSILLDSDNSSLDIYDDSFSLNQSIDLSFYDEFGNSSPAQITVDKDGAYYITLHDTADLIIYINNSLQKIDLYDQVYTGDDNGNPTLDSGFEYQPAAIEILSDDNTLFISFVNKGDKFIQKYNIDRTGGNYDVTPDGGIINLGDDVPMDMVSNRDGDKLYVLTTNYYTSESYIKVYGTDQNNLISNNLVGYGAEFITIDTSQNAFTVSKQNNDDDYSLNLYKYDNNSVTNSSLFSILNTSVNNVGGISGDSYGNIWLLDSSNDRVVVMSQDEGVSHTYINITEDVGNDTNNYVAYGDWNGFRWYNKFGYGGESSYYELTGQSEPFNIYSRDKYNLQKINEDFDATETLKSYRTTDSMLNYDNLFDNFLGSIYGNKVDDGTYIGRNVFEKIANFVLNHSDIDTCTVDSLESLCDEVGIEFEDKLILPRDIKRVVDIFSIKFKKLWGDDYRSGYIDEQVGEVLDVSSYVVSADPQIKIIAKEKFNNNYSIITPTILDSLGNYADTDKSYELRLYDHSWGWGLSIPDGSEISDYYDFYEYNELSTDRIIDIIDWENELTDTSIKDISSFSNYMTTDGIVSTILGDTLREGLTMYK
jgi:hypothetical protein